MRLDLHYTFFLISAQDTSYRVACIKGVDTPYHPIPLSLRWAATSWMVQEQYRQFKKHNLSGVRLQKVSKATLTDFVALTWLQLKFLCCHAVHWTPARGKCPIVQGSP